MKIIAELLAGIDPTTTNLVNNNINEHWLPDESNVLRMTKFTGTISSDLWNPSGNILHLDDTGSTALYWTLDGSNILRLNA